MNTSMARAHRAAFLAAMSDGDVAVIPTGGEVTRSRDTHFKFRPNSDFWYLTAFPEPEAVAVLRAGHDEPFVLFVRPRDAEKEVWNGRRAGVDGARERFGADVAYPIEELPTRLPELLAGAERLFYETGMNPMFDSQVMGMLASSHVRSRDGVTAPGVVVRPGDILHEMRLHKSADELAVMRRAAEITHEAHTGAMAALRPGIYEYEIESLVDGTFRKHGGWGPGYTTIAASGANACILHYTENDNEVSDGELLLLDAGCEVEGYTADVTRTFPASGKFSKAQRDIYDVVLAAQRAGVEHVRPGNTFLSVHETTTRVLVDGMIGIGLLKGTLDENLASEDYRRYFMHKTGHWLGLDVHDVGRYFTEDKKPVSRELAPGMVTTVEPGIYVPADDDTAPEHFRGIGIRLEDDVAVTESGYDNLTASVPITAEDVEAACA